MKESDRRMFSISQSRHLSISGLVFVELLVWLTMSLAMPVAALAVQPTDTEAPATVRKTQEGLHFNLPPDWPIERRNGVVGPIPIEEYLSRKFSAVESRLQEMEKQITAIDLRLRVMEEALKGAQRRLQSGESPPTGQP